MTAYISLTGAASNYVSADDAAALQIVGDELDIRVKLLATTWSGSARELVSRRSDTPFEYSLRLDSLGKPELYWHDGGGFVQPGVASAAVSGSTPKEIRVTRELSGANYLVRYYTDGVANGTQTVAKTGNVPDTGTNNLAIGGRANGDGSGVAGDYYYVEIRSSIDGPIAAKFDPAEAATYVGVQGGDSDSWTGNDGLTWTLNGSGPKLYWPDVEGWGVDAVMSHLSNLNSPPSSAEVVGALNEINGTNGIGYRSALRQYLNLE